jgi:hypothetical protein
MADKIKLVQGDTLPNVRLTLTDPVTGTAINLSAGSTTVNVYFREAGGTTILSTIACTKVNGGSTGVIQFNFSSGVLNVDPGAYEGEVEINFDGQKQTVYELLKFNVREQFT